MALRYACLLLCIVLSPAGLAAAPSEGHYSLDRIRLGQFEGATRVVFDVSGASSHQFTKLSSPPRVVLSMSRARNEAGVSGLPLANTPISSIEISHSDAGDLELVLLLSREVDYKTFTLPPNGDRGNRLVLDLYPHRSETTALSSPAAVNGSHEPSRFAFSGTWEQAWAIETDGGGSQKFEARIEPRLDISVMENTTVTAIGRLRLDTLDHLGPDEDKPDNYSSINGPFYNDAHAEISLRELYLDTKWSDTYWRIGKQQVVWGQADGIKVLDVVNPQSFREFILDDFDRSRIPLTMVNMQAPVGEDKTLQLLWIPDTTYHELAEAGTPYYLSSLLLVPVAPEGITADVRNPDVPDDLIEDSDLGARLSGFVGGWDVTLNYLYHYQDYPVLYQSLNFTETKTIGVVSPEYERNHLSGGTLSNVFGDFTLRAEVAYSTDTFHVSSDIANQGIEDSAELASVFGLDWQLTDYDTLLSTQWFQSHLFNYESSIRRGENEQNMSFYVQRDFANEIWQINALTLYSIDNQDSLVQIKLKYLWRSNIELWFGSDIFSGDRDGIYGQFRDVDRLLLGLEMGF